jgi:hypothetical protein
VHPFFNCRSILLSTASAEDSADEVVAAQMEVCCNDALKIGRWTLLQRVHSVELRATRMCEGRGQRHFLTSESTLKQLAEWLTTLPVN